PSRGAGGDITGVVRASTRRGARSRSPLGQRSLSEPRHGFHPGGCLLVVTLVVSRYARHCASGSSVVDITVHGTSVVAVATASPSTPRTICTLAVSPSGPVSP